MIAWNVGGYVSAKIKSSEWGSNVVTELSEYLRTRDSSLKGYGRRNIYMMENSTKHTHHQNLLHCVIN